MKRYWLILLSAVLGLLFVLTYTTFAAGNSPEVIWQITAHPTSVTALSFSPDQSLIATGSDYNDSTIRLWNASNGTYLKQFKSHTQGVASVDISPDGQLLAEGYIVVNYPFTLTGRMNLWEISSGNLLYTFNGSYVDFSPVGDKIAAGGGSVNHYTDIYDLSDGERLAHFYHGSYILDVAYSPAGNIVASAGTDNRIKLWNVDTGQLVDTLSGHNDDVNTIVFCPDGQYLASGAGGFDNPGESSIKIWRVSDGTLIQSLQGHGDWVNSLDFSPDGSKLISSGRDNPLPNLKNSIKIWRVSDGALLHGYDELENGVFEVAYSPDGLRFGYGLSDGVLVLAQLPNYSVYLPIIFR